MCFKPLFTYKVLKPVYHFIQVLLSFTPLFTYKVLKLIVFNCYKISVLHLYSLTRFSNNLYILLQAALVLHLYSLTRFSNRPQLTSRIVQVLHLYSLTRFSNLLRGFAALSVVLHLYSLTRFSNWSAPLITNPWFYTFIHLQGSQTSN